MTRRWRHSDDGGTAAVEFALFFVVLFGLIAICVPLGNVFIVKTRLERAAGTTARFATQVPDRTRPDTTYRRPTVAEVQAVAVSAFQATGESTATGWSTPIVSANPQAAHPGDTISVTLEKSVNLGPFGALLSAIGFGPRSVDLTATAVGRQE